jgi:hypothetical protein
MALFRREYSAPAIPPPIPTAELPAAESRPWPRTAAITAGLIVLVLLIFFGIKWIFGPSGDTSVNNPAPSPTPIASDNTNPNTQSGLNVADGRLISFRQRTLVVCEVVDFINHV